MKTVVFLGADHAGFTLKNKIVTFLRKRGTPFVDIGTFGPEAVDYPKYASDVARSVVRTKDSIGVLVCGTGTGMAIAANKIKGARAAVVYDEYSAKMARKDDAANIIALRGRNFSPEKSLKFLDVFLKTPFSKKSRHKHRIAQVKILEKNQRL